MNGRDGQIADSSFLRGSKFIKPCALPLLLLDGDLFGLCTWHWFLLTISYKGIGEMNRFVFIEMGAPVWWACFWLTLTFGPTLLLAYSTECEQMTEAGFAAYRTHGDSLAVRGEGTPQGSAHLGTKDILRSLVVSPGRRRGCRRALKAEHQLLTAA